MSQSTHQLQVVITTGLSDPERAAFGFSTALVAASSGLAVTVFLAVKAPVWACVGLENNPEVDHVSMVMEQALEAGVNIEACSTCFEKFCGGGNHPVLRQGFRISGMLSVVQRATQGVPTLTI